MILSIVLWALLVVLIIYLIGIIAVIFSGFVAKVYDYDLMGWPDIFFAALFWPRVVGIWRKKNERMD